MNPNQDQPSIAEVGAAEFESQVLRSKPPVLVAFWTPWSRPCRILDAALGEVASACAGRMKVVKINADDHPELGMWYDIQSVPTLLYFVDGCTHNKLVGTASKEAILSWVQRVAPGGGAGSFTSSPDPGP